MDERDPLVNMAKLAEMCERYDDMADFMKKVVQLKVELTDEERNLLSVAFKNVVGALRCAWRTASCQDQKYEGDEKNTQVAKQYCERLKEELTKICGEVQSLLDQLLSQGGDSRAESKVFYLKMKGDYFRYLAEVCDDKSDAKKCSKDAYSNAFTVSKEEMDPANPIRLGLALNFSVFYYEILNSPEDACKMAQEALDDARGELNPENENVTRDSALIMQLLHDNLSLWRCDNAADEAQAAVKS